MSAPISLKLKPCDRNTSENAEICELPALVDLSPDVQPGPAINIVGDELEISFRGEAVSVRVRLEPGVDLPKLAPDLWQLRLRIPNLSKANALIKMDIFAKEKESNKTVELKILGKSAEPSQRINLSGSTLKALTIQSKYLMTLREIHVWLPPGYDETQTYPVVYIADGAAHFGGLLIDEISKGLISPFVVVGVDNCSLQGKSTKKSCRYEEYVPAQVAQMGNPEVFSLHEHFFMDEVIPFIEKEFRVSNSSSQRAIAGFSNGADWAVAIAEKHPTFFSQVIAMSPPMIGNLPLIFPKNMFFSIGAGYFEPSIMRSAFCLFERIQESNGGADFLQLPYGHGDEINFRVFKESMLFWLNKKSHQNFQISSKGECSVIGQANNH